MAVHIATDFGQSPPQHEGRGHGFRILGSHQGAAGEAHSSSWTMSSIRPRPSTKSRWRRPRIAGSSRRSWKSARPRPRSAASGTCSCRPTANRRHARHDGPLQPRICADLRGPGPLLDRLGGGQLLGARHRQHGSVRPLRHKEHKEKWLKPLLNGEIRSCFAMTEPAVASSDARNVECRIESDGNDYVINGRKWWSSGMGDPRCKVIILMGKSDPVGAGLPPAVDDRRAARHARHQDRQDAARVRL